MTRKKSTEQGLSTMDRILSPFAEVRKGEGTTAALLMLNIFILLTAYYIIKPVREALILGDAGAEIKSYAGAVQALLFLFIVPAYGAFASRVNRLRLINGVTSFFILNLIIFYAVAQMGFSVGIPFFIWVGLFSVMLVAQVWSFANDVYSPEQGKRLFAIAGIGSSLGAIFGAYLAGKLFDGLGPYLMMLLSGGLLVFCMMLTTMIHHRSKTTRQTPQPSAAHEEPIQGAGGFQLVLRHRYLLLIAAMVLLTNVVNTTGEFIMGKAVTENAQAIQASNPGVTDEAYIGKFYADFFFWVNILGAVLQLFVVSRMLKYIGVAAALLFLPCIALGSYTLLAFAPVLGYVRIAKIFENGTDYSVQNTARHALFLGTSREAKYKAKAAIDNFFWRLGDAGSALLVFIGTQLVFNLRDFALVNIVLVLVWLVVVAGIIRLKKSNLWDSEARNKAA